MKENKGINSRILDILFQKSSDSVDAHWDSYNDSYYHDTYNDTYDDYGDNSYYHDEYRDGFVNDKPVIKIKKMTK